MTGREHNSPEHTTTTLNTYAQRPPDTTPAQRHHAIVVSPSFHFPTLRPLPSPVQVEFANPFFPKMRETTTQTHLLFEQWEAITAQQPEFYACCLQTIVAFQAQQIKAFRCVL